jgi:hypothetical protein
MESFKQQLPFSNFSDAGISGRVGMHHGDQSFVNGRFFNFENVLLLKQPKLSLLRTKYISNLKKYGFG